MVIIVCATSRKLEVSFKAQEAPTGFTLQLALSKHAHLTSDANLAPRPLPRMRLTFRSLGLFLFHSWGLAYSLVACFAAGCQQFLSMAEKAGDHAARRCDPAKYE